MISVAAPNPSKRTAPRNQYIIKARSLGNMIELHNARAGSSTDCKFRPVHEGDRVVKDVHSIRWYLAHNAIATKSLTRA